MNGVSLRLQKRQSHGVSGTATYTLSKSRDNTTATSGNATVAQNDQNLDAEWALSNFDRRHQFSGTGNIELPWGRNRHWLNTGGLVRRAWSATGRCRPTLTWQSGTPADGSLRVVCVRRGQGVVGTLRADYIGRTNPARQPDASTSSSTPPRSTVPAAGTFGNSGRNMLIGTRVASAECAVHPRRGAWAEPDMSRST